MVTPLLQVSELVAGYPAGWRRRPAPVLQGVSLTIPAGGALGLVGESGSGKTTLARVVLGLLRPSAGTALLDGVPIATPGAGGKIQAVFQDPAGSLDPRRRVGASVAEPLLAQDVAAPERRARVTAALAAVGLDAAALERRPDAFSGGQRQRIAIARALVTRPALIVADEPVSALDVSVQAQILALIAELRAGGVGWLLITHDLSVVRAVCDRIAVLLAGRIVEAGPTEAVFADPAHAYTKTLLAARPGNQVQRSRQAG